MAAWGVNPSQQYVAKLISTSPTCLNLEYRRRRTQPVPSSLPQHWEEVWELRVPVRHLENSKLAGCFFCACLFVCFRLLVHTKLLALDILDTIVIIDIPSIKVKANSYLRVTFEKVDQSSLSAESQPEVFELHRASLRLSLVKQCNYGPLSIIRPGGYISGHPQCTRSFQKLSDWLEKCTMKHGSLCNAENCGQSADTLPSRLIHVGKGGELPALIETVDAQMKYAALSYCWGGAHFVTEKSSLQLRKQGIAWADLPKTQRQAMTVCRALKIDYIWIDSLCIIQDDQKDWRKESRKMADVYRRAVLVISAAATADAQDGIFLPRTASWTIEPISYDRNKDRPCVIAHEEVDHRPLWDREGGRANWPLQTRGWTLQEGLLATKIVHFTPRELMWECNHGVRCECGDWHGDSSDASTLSPRARLRQALDPASKPKDRAEYWCRLVRAYMGRNLTKDSDRLPAISALARQFRHHPGMGLYRAGIWSAFVPMMISWISAPGQSVHRRPRGYIAPSWSWVSIFGPIDWNYDDFWDGWGDDLLDGPYFEGNWEINVEAEDQDDFGGVLDGRLTFWSPVLHARVHQASAHLRLDLTTEHTLLRDVSGPVESLEVRPGDKIVCAFLEIVRSSPTLALVLKLSRKMPGCFVRVGMVYIRDASELQPLLTRKMTVI